MEEAFDYAQANDHYQTSNSGPVHAGAAALKAPANFGENNVKNLLNKVRWFSTSISFRYVLVLLTALILADGLVTEYSVFSGLAWESNPLMQGLLPGGYLMPVKMIGSILAVLLLWNINKHQPRMARVACWTFVALYTGIVYWNLFGMYLALNY